MNKDEYTTHPVWQKLKETKEKALETQDFSDEERNIFDMLIDLINLENTELIPRKLLDNVLNAFNVYSRQINNPEARMAQLLVDNNINSFFNLVLMSKPSTRTRNRIQNTKIIQDFEDKTSLALKDLIYKKEEINRQIEQIEQDYKGIQQSRIEELEDSKKTYQELRQEIEEEIRNDFLTEKELFQNQRREIEESGVKNLEDLKTKYEQYDEKLASVVNAIQNKDDTIIQATLTNHYTEYAKNQLVIGSISYGVAIFAIGLAGFFVWANLGIFDSVSSNDASFWGAVTVRLAFTGLAVLAAVSLFKIGSSALEQYNFARRQAAENATLIPFLKEIREDETNDVVREVKLSYIKRAFGNAWSGERIENPAQEPKNAEELSVANVTPDLIKLITEVVKQVSK